MKPALLALAVAAMGAMGALCRWGLGTLVGGFVPGRFPWGTLAANALGCLALGMVTGLASAVLPDHLRIPLATGFLGSFTTFSTFSVESVRLVEQGHYGLASAYVGGSLLLGLAFAAVGLSLGRALS